MVKPARRVSGLNFKVAVGRHAYCNFVLRRRRTTAPKTDVNEGSKDGRYAQLRASGTACRQGPSSCRSLLIGVDAIGEGGSLSAC